MAVSRTEIDRVGAARRLVLCFPSDVLVTWCSHSVRRLSAGFPQRHPEEAPHLSLFCRFHQHCLFDGRGMIPCLKIKKADVRPLSCALPVELPSDLHLPSIPTRPIGGTRRGSTRIISSPVLAGRSATLKWDGRDTPTLKDSLLVAPSAW